MLTPRIPDLPDYVARALRDIEALKKRPTGGGARGATGADGPPGVSVTSATVNTDGHLIVTLSDGTTLDTGQVVGPQGEPGVSPTLPAVSVVAAYLSASTTAASAGFDLAWPSLTENQGGWGLASSNVRLMVPISGLYNTTMQAVWDSPSTAGAIASLGCYVCRNGDSGAQNGTAANERPSTPGQTVMQATGQTRLAAGDYLVGRVYTSTATNLRGTAHPNSYGGTYLTATKIAD